MVDQNKENEAAEAAGQAALGDVKTFEDLERDHVETAVEYPQTPSVGGDHNPAWQNCGFYDSEVAPENATHSLEHGAVWIGYSPDLADDRSPSWRTSSRRTTTCSPAPSRAWTPPSR